MDWYKHILLATGVAAALVAAASHATEPLTLEGMLGRVMASYEALPTAELKLQRARQEKLRVQSQLGWSLTGTTGASHDVNFLGAPADTVSASASVARKLASGASVGVSGNYTYQDSSLSLSPLLPNPSHAADLDLNYRLPLGRGAGNPDYVQGLASAEAGEQLAEAQRRSLYDQVADRAAGAFYAAADTRAQLANAHTAVSRAKRLLTYVQSNLRLGIAEQLDLLQARAQLREREAEVRSLEVVWVEQRAALNRLMGTAPGAMFEPRVPDRFPRLTAGIKALTAQAERYSPALLQDRALLKQARATVARARDARKDTVDLVMSVGSRTRTGDSGEGKLNESDVAGGVSVEYRRALDSRGFDAALYQAQLDRRIALQNIKTVRADLRYAVASSVAEIAAADRALAGYRASLASERKKYTDALKRYKTGRSDTQLVIQFENDLRRAELNVARKTIDLARKHARLRLLRGTLWGAAANTAGKHQP